MKQARVHTLAEKRRRRLRDTVCRERGGSRKLEETDYLSMRVVSVCRRKGEEGPTRAPGGGRARRRGRGEEGEGMIEEYKREKRR